LNALKLLLILIFSPLALLAQQKIVVHEQQIWGGYNITKKFNARWGIWMDGEIHTKENFVSEFSQFTLRFAGSYYLKNKNRFTAGYGFTDYLPGDNHKSISIPEHFLWQQFQLFKNTSKHKLMQWFRTEEKWKENVVNDYTAADTYTLYYKFRYNIFYQLPLSKMGFVPNKLSLAVGDELYLYYGPTMSNHVFDQNRVFLGLSYAVNAHDNFVFGYLNILQQNQTATVLKNSSILKMTLFLNL
jgi:hypothetical protein